MSKAQLYEVKMTVGGYARVFHGVAASPASAAQAASKCAKNNLGSKGRVDQVTRLGRRDFNTTK